jgi:hypothetical protein
MGSFLLEVQKGPSQFCGPTLIQNNDDYKLLIKDIKGGTPWHVLYPAVFLHAYEHHHNESMFADKILSPVLALLQTRRLIMTPIWDGEKYHVQTLPKCNISTDLIDFDNPKDRKYYMDTMACLVKDLFIPTKRRDDDIFTNEKERLKYHKDKFETAKMDSNVLRQLNITNTHPSMFHLLDPPNLPGSSFYLASRKSSTDLQPD